MDASLFNLEKYKTGKGLNQRQDLIKMFVDQLSKERNAENEEIKWQRMNGKNVKPFPAINPKLIAIKLSHVPTNELQQFFDACKNASHFSKFFFWSLKVARVEKKND